jgi:cation:H+ antiporter
MITKTLEFVGKIGMPGIVISDIRVIFLFGTVLLLVGAQIFTDALVDLAGIFAIPGIIVGLTIGAIGPSIPNLAAALQAVRKGYDELAVSETIGANIFTLLITIGVIAIISPFSIDPKISVITAPAILVITGLFFVFMLTGRITRTAGICLFITYIITLVLEVITWQA